MHNNPALLHICSKTISNLKHILRTSNFKQYAEDFLIEKYVYFKLIFSIPLACLFYHLLTATCVYF